MRRLGAFLSASDHPSVGNREREGMVVGVVEFVCRDLVVSPNLLCVMARKQ